MKHLKYLPVVLIVGALVMAPALTMVYLNKKEEERVNEMIAWTIRDMEHNLFRGCAKGGLTCAVVCQNRAVYPLEEKKWRVDTECAVDAKNTMTLFERVIVVTRGLDDVHTYTVEQIKVNGEIQ